MVPKPLLKLSLACAVAATMACQSVDLATALRVTDVFGGWYDHGVSNGLNKLVPSVTFRLRNESSSPITDVQLLVSFWQDGADGEWDSKDIRGISGGALPPGGSTEPILVRAAIGYTLEQPRAELFSHGQFKDVSVKIFGKRGGKIVPLGQFKIDRRILPHSITSATP